ncbi:GIY-YIG nuclease family protein [candidate division KSB1 bacterium]
MEIIMYYVYILYSKSFDRYYIGQTDNIDARIDRHNKGKVKSTKHYVPWELRYTEKFISRSKAMKREKFLKNQRNKEFYKRLIDSSIGTPRTRGEFSGLIPQCGILGSIWNPDFSGVLPDKQKRSVWLNRPFCISGEYDDSLCLHIIL